jgi:predicted ATP-binding protein involved in virulence
VGVSGTAWQAKAEALKRRYNVEVTPFAIAEDYGAVDVFLQELGDRTAEERSKQTQAPPAVGSRLRRIILRNIGPFEELELDLPEPWLVLLGDNGVGKSSILKALAVAMVGSEANAVAGRLVREGESLATITLITDRNPSGYFTEIYKLRSTGEASVVSKPSRPLESEGWITLGFPPLRSVSWQPSAGPQALTKRGPSAEDILPLARGEVDPRMDKLKQWIVNLDTWSKEEQLKGHENSRPMQILRKFFEIVGRITKGMEVQRAEVTSNFEVKVHTKDDGVLPIEALSQGMTSLYGWVGILVQRLYEVYDTEEDPTHRYALVLMDEIDAHMHPAWQQVLIRRLKEIFPRVQMIVTTHSPLIIGGLPISEVARFERDKSGKVVRLDVPEDMTMGRADLILTGTLFGLQSTLDEDTEKLIESYQTLLRKAPRTLREEEELQRLQKELNPRIPVDADSLEARRARELLRALLDQQEGETSPEVQEELLLKASRLLDVLQSDSWSVEHRAQELLKVSLRQQVGEVFPEAQEEVLIEASKLFAEPQRRE